VIIFYILIRRRGVSAPEYTAASYGLGSCTLSMLGLVISRNVTVSSTACAARCRRRRFTSAIMSDVMSSLALCTVITARRLAAPSALIYHNFCPSANFTSSASRVAAGSAAAAAHLCARGNSFINISRRRKRDEHVTPNMRAAKWSCNNHLCLSLSKLLTFYWCSHLFAVCLCEAVKQAQRSSCN